MAEKSDLELVQVRDGQPSRTWPHGCPFRTVQWHLPVRRCRLTHGFNQKRKRP